MGSFGERLRREREMRGIGLDEIATATKISARNLRALEEEKFNQLPGGIFNKGFVRAYARFLGIDEDLVVGEYEVAAQETEAAREQKLREEFAKAEFRKQKKESEISLEPKSQWGTIAAIVLIAALIYGGYSVYQRKKAERQHQAMPKAVTPSVATPPVLPAATPPPLATSEAVSSVASKPETTAAIELKIKVNKQSWVSIKADGKTLVSDTLEPGIERTFKAADKIEMILGNAGGVEVSYNGKPVTNLNGDQVVRKMTFTASGYE